MGDVFNMSNPYNEIKNRNRENLIQEILSKKMMTEKPPNRKMMVRELKMSVKWYHLSAEKSQPKLVK